MASITLTRTAAPYLSGNATTVGASQAIPINYPSGLRSVSVLFVGADGEMAPTGTEGVALGSADKHEVTADQYLVIRVKPEAGTVYVQSATHPTVIRAIGEYL